MSCYELTSAVGEKVYLSIALFYKNGWIKLYNIFTPYLCIWDVSIKGRRACKLSLFQSLPCFCSTWCCINTSWETLCSKQHVEWPETHAERQEMPRIHPGDVSLQVLGLHDQEQTKDSCKAKLFVITVLFTQTGKSSKESPVWIALFTLLCLLHACPFQTPPCHGGLWLGCQVHTVSPKRSSAFASTLYQHCHGYVIILANSLS